VAAGPADGRTELWSAELDEGQTFDATVSGGDSPEGWAKYPWAVTQAMGGRPNIRAFVTSDLPMASGVSSSAALEVAFANIYNAMDGGGRTPTEIALLGQRAENDYVGVRCGIMDQMAMDQMASACGVEGHALLIDTRSLERTPIPLPEGVRIVLCETGSPRELATSAYNTRRQELEVAEQELGKSLRDCTISDLPSVTDYGSKVWILRARHVISENRRTLAFRKALEVVDREAIFHLMQESHESMRQDFAASSEPQDAMAQAAWQSPGVWGARITGGGFGGACVALVDQSKVDEFCMRCEQMFRSLVKGHRPTFVVCSASRGAGLIDL